MTRFIRTNALLRFSLPLLLALGGQGCEQASTTLTLARPASPIDEGVAGSISETFAEGSDIEIALSADEVSEEDALAALTAGDLDLALISNSMPYTDGVGAVMPMYPTVLHVGSSGTHDRIIDLPDLLRDASVFAGPEGSASRVMFDRMVRRPEFRDLGYSLLEPERATAPPDVFVIFAPIATQYVTEQMRNAPRFSLVSMGDPDSIGRGSVVDAATLSNPFFRPFVIPVGVYGAATPEPVLTVAVDKMLLARPGLEPSTVYDLIGELLRLRPALAARNPGLFRDLSGDFDSRRSTFVLHPGAQAYLERSAPSVYERYSGIAEVVVTLMVGLISAGFAGLRIYRVRRKNRIDTFYTETIRLRNTITDRSSADERHAVLGKVRELQNEAFQLLVDEKLDADDSFRIFMTLSNDVIDALSEPTQVPA